MSAKANEAARTKARAALAKALDPNNRGDNDLLDRFDRWSGDLIEGLSEVYDIKTALPELVKVLIANHANRDEVLRARDRQRKLISKIDAALRRIEDGSYGFCEETGEPIGIPRLLARPTATLSLEAQQRRELKQKMFGD